MTFEEEENLRTLLYLLQDEPLSLLKVLCQKLPQGHLVNEDKSFVQKESERLLGLVPLVEKDSDDEYELRLLIIALIASTLVKLSMSDAEQWLEAFDSHPDITTSEWGIA